MKIKIPEMKRAYLAIILAIAAIAALYFVVSSFTGRAVEVGKYDKFAMCLADKGVIMYGSESCHFCNNQKLLFGDSFKYVNYVECPQNVQLCTSKGIRAYPTWEINGMLYEGLQLLEQLSSLSGCSLS